MTDPNYVGFIGRVVKDAVITQYANNTKVANFTIVLNRDRKIGENWEEKSAFVDLALFGKTAESYVKYLTKGKVIAVEGHIEQDRWEKDGKQMSKLKVAVDKIYPFIAGNTKKDGSDAVASTGPSVVENSVEADIPPESSNGEIC